MEDLVLIGAGAGGVLVALIHGYLGRTAVLPNLAGASASARRVNAAVFQLSTLYWLAGGAVLIAAPFVLSQSQRTLAAGMMAFVYAAAAIGNFWATRGRHPGWMLLAIVTGMALIGA
ncbi:MAG: hypothetical protein R3D02_14350 [Hyphomicrobiales bacterium]